VPTQQELAAALVEEMGRDCVKKFAKPTPWAEMPVRLVEPPAGACAKGMDDAPSCLKPALVRGLRARRVESQARIPGLFYREVDLR